MTTILIDLSELSGVDPETINLAKASIDFSPFIAYEHDDGEWLTRNIRKAKLPTGTGSIVLPPTPTGKGYEVQERGWRGVRHGYIVLADQEEINYSDVQWVTKASLDPVTPPDPAWLLAWQGTQDQLDELAETVDGKLDSNDLDSSNEALIEDDDSLTSLAVAAKIGRVLTPEAFGAVGDGTTDDTAAIQAMFDAITPFTTVHFSNSHKTTVSVNVTSKTQFHIEGPGGIAFAGVAASTAGEIAALLIQSCTYAEVSGLHVEVVTQDQLYDGIRVSGSDQVNVHDNTVIGARWAGIEIKDVSGAGRPSDVTVDRNRITGCRYGIAARADRIKITGNYIAMDWFSTAEAASPWTSASEWWDGVILGSCTDYVVTDNLLYEVGQSGIYVTTAARGVISNNTIIRPQNWGIDFGPSTVAEYANISGNTLVDCAEGGINLDKTNYSGVTGNTVINTGALYHGAIIDKALIALNSTSSFNTVASNTLRQAATATQPALFINDAGTPGTGNRIGSNTITGAATPYSVNTVLNTLDAPVTTRIWVSPDMMTTTGGAAVAGLVNANVPCSLYDAAATEGRAATVVLPSDWNTFNVVAYWANPTAAAGAVRWVYWEGWTGTGETLSLTGVLGTIVTAGGQYVQTASTLYTGRTAKAGKSLLLGIYRDGANAGDTLANDAALLGVSIEKAS